MLYYEDNIWDYFKSWLEAISVFIFFMLHWFIFCIISEIFRVIVNFADIFYPQEPNIILFQAAV